VPFHSSALAAPMPHKYDADRRHHIPKMSFKVQNWPAYEAGLRRRGGPEPDAGSRTPEICPQPSGHPISPPGLGSSRPPSVACTNACLMTSTNAWMRPESDLNCAYDNAAFGEAARLSAAQTSASLSGSQLP
jgi:hypothetical protein